MNLWIGASALRASQYGINQVSQNLANANTEGYHRQVVGFQARPSQSIGGLRIGSGVEVSGVKRIRDQIVESAFTNSIADLGEVEQRLSIETRIESLFLSGEGTVQNSLTGFFDELARLSANPGEKSLRSSVLNQANNLTGHIQETASGLVELKNSVRQQIEIEVNGLNQDIENLVTLQNQIKTRIFQGTPNDLLDQRDQLINKIAEKIDIQRFESVQGSLGLGIAGSSISIGVVAVQFETVTSPEGDVQLQAVGGDRATKFASGKVAALVDVHNNLIDEYSQKLDTLTEQLIRDVDQAHATGVGLDGPFSILRSARNSKNTTVPLNESGLPFSIESGQLHVSVTAPDGRRQLYTLDIDPSVDSLDDLAAQISSVDHIQGVVDSQTGQLAIIAQPGYGFDFAGQLETHPDVSSFTGSSVPTLSGNYQGTTNQEFTVTALGSGIIGKTPGLKAEVTDQFGSVIKEINIGEGYEAGSEIELSDGVSLRLSVGDIAVADEFSTKAVAVPDSTGVLTALGLNSFFHGTESRNIEVNSALLEDPDKFATSKSGDIGDTRNLSNLIELRNRQALGDGRQTFD
ncbi:MAG: flagellar hook-associated protein 1 FlgK, partial [Mariniblastus sp.]